MGCGQAPAYANTHHDAAQPAEALAEEVSELQAQLRLETQRKLLAEGKSKLLELELEAVRVQLEEAFERRLADHQKKDGEPSVVEGLKESLKSAHVSVVTTPRVLSVLTSDERVAMLPLQKLTCVLLCLCQERYEKADVARQVHPQPTYARAP